MDELFGFPTIELPDPATVSPESALRFLVEQLVASGALPQRHAPACVAALLQREALGSTAVGQGVAIPHTNRVPVDQPVGVVGRSPVDVPWPALDGLPVRTICLVLLPPHRPGEHLLVLQRLAVAVRNGDA